MVAVLPTACGSAYADDDSPDVVEVGGVSAAEQDGDADNNEADNDGAAAEDDADQNGDQNEDQAADAEGEQAAEDDAAAQEDAAAAQEEDAAAQEGEQDPNAQDQNGDGGEEGGEFNEAPANAKGGQEPPPPDGGGNENGQLDVLGVDCTNSQLEPHNGFEVAPACVDTAFGEVASEDQSPSLLITEAPEAVAVGEDFSMTVSTRNLIRDRFLGAADGGYYAESSFLNEEGLQRGHFHTACRILENEDEAPDSAPAPEFFVATQDNGGGAAPDQVQIDVTGIDQAGTVQCSSWAGDGSHRIPMMQRANQTPAFDSVRVQVQ